MADQTIQTKPSLQEAKNLQSGRRMSHLEGFIQTIGINMGGIFVPNFILTAVLLNIMHASNTLIGFTTSAQFFIGLLQPLASIFMPREKSRRLVVALSSLLGRGLFVASIFMGMFFSGPGAESVFMFVLLIAAFSMSFSSMGWSTWMADLVPDSIRGRYFALRNSIAALAGIAAPLLGGWILKTYSGADYSGLLGYIIIYSIAGATALIGFFLLLFQYDPPSKEYNQESLLSGWKEILKDKNFMAFIRMVMFFNLAINIASPFYSVHYLDVLHIPIDTLAWLTSLAAVTGILGNFFFGKLSEILGNRLIIRLNLVAAIIPAAVLPFIPVQHKLLGAGATILFQSFVTAGWNLAVFNSSISLSPQGRRSLYIGIYSALNSISAILAPLIGGWLMDLYKSHPVPVFGHTFPATYIVFILSALLLALGLLGFPRYKEDQKHQDYSLKDVLFRLDFVSVIYHLFLSTFLPRINERQKIAEEIADIKSPAAVKPLERLLKDMDPEIRLAALEGLGKTRAENALDILLDYYPKAGSLEKEELLRALESFCLNSQARSILITELGSPYPIMRLRALHSLQGAAALDDVRTLCEKMLVAAKDSKNLSEEEYLAYLDLAMKAGLLNVLEPSFKRFCKASQRGKSLYLYTWSQIFSLRKEFYYFVSLDQKEDQEKKQEELRISSCQQLVKHPALKEGRIILERRFKEYRPQALVFFNKNRPALEQALSQNPREFYAFLSHFLDLETLSLEEEVFVLLIIRQLLNQSAKN